MDAFPMGIDYDRFSKVYDDKDFQHEAKEIVESLNDTKMILSIDRLDYTKGIPDRIRAFSLFLSKYPEYREKVRLNLIVAPSRVKIDSYDELRREITELVSEINGEYGTVSWMPIWFFFQSFTQESLIAFYRHSDVLLVTPLRDGMNLVAKEYIASRTDYEGMVVISETAGAASELGEAVVVNVNDYDAIASGIKSAFEMPHDERIARNKIMHKRIKRYNVELWANEFLSALNQTVIDSANNSQISIEKDSSIIENAYKNAQKRVLFLDYDGTLVGFRSLPEQAKPDEALMKLLFNLASDPKNMVVIVSGRDRHTLNEWFGDLNIHLLAAHGLWLRRHPDQEWTMTVSFDNEWKDSIRHILERYTDRMPGSLIEEKDYSLAWHYRKCDPDMISAKLSEVREAIRCMTQSMSLGIQEGNKVIEIKDNRVNKGNAASLFIQNQEFDFILGGGDDNTDEDLFSSLPENAYTIKIGLGNTLANYRLKSWKSMRLLLEKLVNCKPESDEV